MSILTRFKNSIKYEFLKWFKPEIIGLTRNFQGKKVEGVRISNTAHISKRENVVLENGVFIAHFSYVDGYKPVEIAEGAAIGSYTSVLTHSSHNTLRLYGSHYLDNFATGLKGQTSAPVKIGQYSFVGPNVVIMPGTIIGDGCIVAAFSLVSGTFPNYSIIKGNPAVVVGDTRKLDEALLRKYPDLRDYYYLNRPAKKRKVFLFTQYFPYTHQGVAYDSYVKNEVDALAANFDSVEIISLSKGHDGQLDVPSNVIVHSLSSAASFLDKCKLVNIFWRDYFRYELYNLRHLYNRVISYGLLKSISIYAIKAEKQALFLKSLLKEIDFKQTDVWIYSYWNFEEALASVLVQKNYPIKTVIRSHSLDLYFDRVPERYLPFRRYAYFKSNLFTFISEQGMNYFFKTHKITPNLYPKAFVSRIGIKNAQPLYQHDYSKLVILSNAWIRPLKRIDLLIKSLALINDFNVEWIHVGDDYGTNAFPPLKDMAKELLGPKKNIHYEFIGRKSLEELFVTFAERKINLLINLSSTEGTPVSMMEAVSFGVPVIATAVGGVPEIVEDGKNGFLIDANVTPEEVAEKIKFYFHLPAQKKQELSQKARKIWEERFDSGKNSQILLERLLLYNSNNKL
jgi:colanic acid/amylovoran biosynthesis glycosyltransferase